jgi:biotin transport system substrate-specific component
MNKELSAPLTSRLVSRLAFSAAPAAATWLRTTGIVLAGSAFVAVCAQIALPLYFTPVPLSLAPFAVLLLGLLLSPRLAAATLGTYLAEGALGLPVFSPNPLMTGGLAHLFGPTGGYLLADPLAATLISLLWRRARRGASLEASLGAGRSFTTAALSAAAGNLVLLLCGALWLAALTHASAQSILTLAVLPFLPGDVLKIAAAAALATGFERLRRRSA